MTAKDLKNSILQMAIEGKLVEQREEEGSAETLYAEIQKEKAKLIKAGKIKKEKPLPEITDDEIPFEIPKSWIFCKLNSIVSELGDGLHGTPLYDDNGQYYFINGNNLSDRKIIIKSNTKKVSVSEFNKYKKNLNCKSIIVSINGTLGNIAYYNDESIILGKSACYFNILNKISKDYLFYLLKSKYFIDYANKIATGSTIKNVSLDAMRNLIVSLPPLEEQHRIVEKIEELMPLVDRYGELYDKLEKLNTEFPNKLKNAILKKAMEGKFTEQEESDGNANDLYAEIQKEKAKLIKEGKIKKEKPLPEITDDEIPFMIPKNWKWIKLGEISSFSGGYAFKSVDYKKEGVRVIRISDFDNNSILNDEIVRYKYDEKMSECVINVGDILMCMTGGTVGKTCIVDNICEKMVINQRVAKITSLKCNSKYIYYVVTSPFIQDIIHSNKTSTNDNISKELINSFVMPLPPLVEQNRIVEKIEELMLLVDRYIEVYKKLN